VKQNLVYSSEPVVMSKARPAVPTTRNHEKPLVGKQTNQEKCSPSLWQRLVAHLRKAKRELAKIQGVWEQMDTPTVENAEMPFQMLIHGSACTSADGATRNMMLKSGCIHMGDIKLTLDQDGLLCVTRKTGCSARYRKASLAAADMVTNFQGEWQPQGLQAHQKDSPRLVIQGLTWRLAGPSASIRTQGFVLYDKVEHTTLTGGCKVATGLGGTLLVSMHNGHDTTFVRDMEATAAIFIQRLGYASTCQCGS